MNKNYLFGRALGVLAILVCFAYVMSLSSCDDIVVPTSIEESIDESSSSITTRAGGADYGIQIIGTPPFSSAEPVHGLPGVTSYKFFVGNPPTGTTGVTIIFTAPDGSNYPHSMTQNSSGNWYKQMTLSQSGHYTVVYRIYQGSSYTTVTPIPSYVDNTRVDVSGITKKLIWPFGADGSTWTNQASWVMTCGHGCNMHTVAEGQYYSLDWANGTSGAAIKSPLDGIVVRKRFHVDGGNQIGIEQTIGSMTYFFQVGHLQDFASGIAIDSYVQAGITTIGYVGSTGNVTGPHAHTSLKANSLSGASTPFDFSAQ